MQLTDRMLRTFLRVEEVAKFFFRRKKERKRNVKDRQRYCYNFRERENGGVETDSVRNW